VPLLGKQLTKSIIELIDKIYYFIIANFSSLTIALSIFVIDAEQCMTSFNLPTKFDPNPERIGRIVSCRVVPPQKKLFLG
jgi:hypothetical protein